MCGPDANVQSKRCGDLFTRRGSDAAAERRAREMCSGFKIKQFTNTAVPPLHYTPPASSGYYA